jgi:hypothetical protein
MATGVTERVPWRVRALVEAGPRIQDFKELPMTLRTERFGFGSDDFRRRWATSFAYARALREDSETD